MEYEEVNSNIHLPHYSHGIHVLLVEYDQISLSKSTLLLRKASFRVTPTKIQQVALTVLREVKEKYSLIITSDQKQELDCHSFIQRIRFIDEDIPIIVVSSAASNADQGLKTLFDSACYLVNKPVTENALWHVLQQHVMRQQLSKRREDDKRKGKLVIGNGREEEHGLQVENNRNLKRNKPCENEEAAAKKKGKCIVEPSMKNGSKTTEVRASTRPTIDPAQHKKLMDSVSYHGPSKGRDFMFPRKSQAQEDREKKIKEDFNSTPRAAWTQHLYKNFMQVMSCDVPGMGGYGYSYGYGYGYGVQQPHPFQMNCLRPRPSWISPQDWITQMQSQILNNPSNVGAFPMFGLSGHCKAPTAVNGGLNFAGLGMNGVGFNGMDQSLHLGGTQSNPISLEEVHTSNAPALNQSGVPSDGGLSGFFHGAEDEMGFGLFAGDDPHSRDLHPAVHKGNSEVTSSYSLQPELGHLNYYGLFEAGEGNNMMSAPITGFNESIGYGQNVASHELLHTENASSYCPVRINEPGLYAANQPDFTPTATSTFCAMQNAYDLSTSNAALQMTELKSSIGESDGQELFGTGLVNSGFAPPYSSVNVDRSDLHVVDQQQLSASGENARFGSQNASNFPIPTSGSLAPVDDASLQAVVRSCFQSSDGVLPTGSEVDLWPNLMPEWGDTFLQTNQDQMRAFNAAEREVEEYVNHEPVKGQNVVNGQAFVTPSTNEVDISGNGSNKQASEEEEKTKNLNSQGHVDEFADLFTFLDAYQDGTSSVSDEDKEVNSDKGTAQVEDHTYFDFDFDFDFDSFDFS